MAKYFNKKNDPFIRRFTALPPQIMLYTNAQIRTYYEICKRDIIYFDSTGSIIKRFDNEKDFQIYTILVRNPYQGGPSLPVASFVSACHDANTI